LISPLALVACKSIGEDRAAAGTVAPGDHDPSAGREQARERIEPGESAPPAFEGTAGITQKTRPELQASVLLREVRVGRHAGFDRTVFEFAGDHVPGYRVEYIDKPARLCGTGEPAEIAGQGWLSVRLSPAQAHDERGRPLITDRERRPGLPVLRELEQTCDFEGDVTWVFGLSAPNRYRVLELSNPPRLVVDVKH